MGTPGTKQLENRGAKHFLPAEYLPPQPAIALKGCERFCVGSQIFVRLDVVVNIAEDTLQTGWLNETASMGLFGNREGKL